MAVLDSAKRYLVVGFHGYGGRRCWVDSSIIGWYVCN